MMIEQQERRIGHMEAYLRQQTSAYDALQESLESPEDELPPGA